MKYFIFILNLVAILVSAGFFLYCSIQIILHAGDVSQWLIKCGISLLVTGLCILLHFVRKTHYPCPGIEYR